MIKAAREVGYMVFFAWAMVLCAVAFVPFAAAGQVDLEIVSPAQGETVPLLSERQRAFVGMDFDERAEYFKDDSAKKKEIRTWGTRPLPVRLKWKGVPGQKCDVIVRRRGTEEVSFSAIVEKDSIDVWNLEIGREYEWTVRRGAASAVGWFATDATAPRFLNISGVQNCRDLGGRVGLNGRRVRQGRVFRTAQFNRSTAPNRPPPGPALISSEGVGMMVGRLGIKTDIDLRRKDECLGMAGSPLGPNVEWLQIHASVLCYSNLVFSAKGREQFAKIFRVFLDESKYPIVFHCAGGADRTGTVGMALNALLGVCEEDLWKDYQVTAMWGTVGDARHFRAFNRLMHSFDAFPGKTLCERVEAFVKSVGFTDAEIAAFRNLMLEP